MIGCLIVAFIVWLNKDPKDREWPHDETKNEDLVMSAIIWPLILILIPIIMDETKEHGCSCACPMCEKDD